MLVKIREFKKSDIFSLIQIWNDVVEDGLAFPQEEYLEQETGLEFFSEQSYTGVAYDVDSGEVVGLYILHPNNIGRCGHICNSSYAVKKGFRGLHVGEELVKHCLTQARDLGFRILQFNAVVSSNFKALNLYEKLGFVRLGTIPEGFLFKDGTYQDIIPHYKNLLDENNGL